MEPTKVSLKRLLPTIDQGGAEFHFSGSVRRTTFIVLLSPVWVFRELWRPRKPRGAVLEIRQLGSKCLVALQDLKWYDFNLKTMSYAMV